MPARRAHQLVAGACLDVSQVRPELAGGDPRRMPQVVGPDPFRPAGIVQAARELVLEWSPRLGLNEGLPSHQHLIVEVAAWGPATFGIAGQPDPALQVHVARLRSRNL